MAAKKGNINAKGNSGAKFWGKDNREKAATLKGLVIDECIRILQSTEKKNEKFKRDIILKLATTCIPQEHRVAGSDENNTPIPIQISKEIAEKNDIKPMAENSSD